MTSGANRASPHQDQEGSCSTSCFSSPQDNLRLPKFFYRLAPDSPQSINFLCPAFKRKWCQETGSRSVSSASWQFHVVGICTRYNSGACTGILPRCTASMDHTPGTENTYRVSPFFFSVGRREKQELGGEKGTLLRSTSDWSLHEIRAREPLSRL
ncbi:hypothetical protein EDD15DRAFT_2296088 [Pisolithus albus]|nr:hypothetical protein EDD15DRAFT_2296088 [Pisolithus albus]